MKSMLAGITLLLGMGLASGMEVSKQTKNATQIERIIGACQPIENKPESSTSAINNVTPVGAAWAYLKRIENKRLDSSILGNSTVTILQGPARGNLSPRPNAKSFMYVSSDYQYEGQDTATVLVEMGGYKFRVMYYFNLLHDVPGSSDQGTAYDDKTICPNGYIWKISKEE